MIKTLLLCFIHGFKGDEETFFQFPDELRKLVGERKPDLDVRTAVYPRYETRGDLAACVETFREWLQDQVTTLEVDSKTASAITDPSVSVILVAHSMGGFVAADTLFSVLDHRPVSSDKSKKLMFPLVQGVLAFDTPYNGLSRSLFAYGAFSQYRNLSSVWNLYSSITSLGAGAATSQIASDQVSSYQTSSWARWGALASRTGTYGALLAGGAAAYANRAEIAAYLSKINRQNISESWAKVNRENLSEGLTYISRESVGEGFAWISGHLKFVGALMKQAQLKTRVERLNALQGVGIANLYASMGENGYWQGGYFIPKRTFVAVPTEEKKPSILWKEHVNSTAANEIEAHCNMFRPEQNPVYEEMAQTARDLVVQWLDNDPRAVLDDYHPDRLQLSRSNSEAQLFDDDGNVLHGNTTPGVAAAPEEGDDEMQLHAILTSSSMPQPEDGGISDEDLRRAAAVPLPVEETAPDGSKVTTWRSRIPNPMASVKMPKVPAVSMPKVPTVSMPKVPSMSLPGWRPQVKKQAEDASDIPEVVGGEKDNSVDGKNAHVATGNQDPGKDEEPTELSTEVKAT